MLVGVWPAHAQVRNPRPLPPLELRQDRTGYNLQSPGGVPLSSTPGIPRSNGRAPTIDQQEQDGLTKLPATPRQFQGQIVFGGLAAPREHNLNPNVSYVANAGAANLDLPRGVSEGRILVVMPQARVGAPWLGRQISFQFGAVIPVPLVNVNGDPLPPGRDPTDYWLAEPHRPTSLATNDLVDLASLAGQSSERRRTRCPNTWPAV